MYFPDYSVQGCKDGIGWCLSPASPSARNYVGPQQKYAVTLVASNAIQSLLYREGKKHEVLPSELSV